MSHESKRIGQIHFHLKGKGYEIWKIEAQQHGGVADAYYSGDGTDLWIEYKSQHFRKRVPTKPALSPMQLRWCTQQERRGRNVWVVILGDRSHVILDSVEEWHVGITPSR